MNIMFPHQLEKLYLLTGQPIDFNKLGKIYQPTLKEIANIGFKNFNQFISFLIFEIEELELNLDEESLKELNLETFDIILLNCKHENFREKIIFGLSFFLKEPVYFNENHGFFFIGDMFDQKFISKENYEEIKKIIKKICYINENKINEPEYNPKGKGAKKLAEQMKKNRETIAKIKAKRSSSKTDFADLISSFCVYGNIDITKIWNLSYYQFNEQFYRSQLFEDYNIKIKSLLAGADPKKIDVKHYTEGM